MSRAAVLGGAVAIRADRPENIIQIKNQVNVPLIGLYKKSIPIQKFILHQPFTMLSKS